MAEKHYCLMTAIEKVGSLKHYRVPRWGQGAGQPCLDSAMSLGNIVADETSVRQRRKEMSCTELLT